MPETKRVYLQSGIKVTLIDANLEVIARIARTMARKYGYDIEIDFDNGPKVNFIGGDDVVNSLIANRILAMFCQDTKKH